MFSDSFTCQLPEPQGDPFSVGERDIFSASTRRNSSLEYSGHLSSLCFPLCFILEQTVSSLSPNFTSKRYSVWARNF